MEALVPPPCTGEMREENFPPRVVIVGDEGTLTIVACAAEYSLCLSADSRPKDVARGLVWARLPWTGTLTPSPSRYVIDWGMCPSVCHLTEFQTKGHCPTLYIPYKQLPQAHGLSTTFVPL